MGEGVSRGEVKMKFLFVLLSAVFASPIIRSYSIKTLVNGDTSGSIEVSVGDDEWKYEWPEMNDDVKNTVNAKLAALNIEGGLDDDFNFKLGPNGLGFDTKQFVQDLSAKVNVDTGAGQGDANNITWSDTFTGSSLEELEKFLKDSHAKILDVVKQHSESFYEIVKEQLSKTKLPSA